MLGLDLVIYAVVVLCLLLVNKHQNILFTLIVFAGITTLILNGKIVASLIATSLYFIYHNKFLNPEPVGSLEFRKELKKTFPLYLFVTGLIVITLKNPELFKIDITYQKELIIAVLVAGYSVILLKGKKQ